jgi:hypothetical protein
MWGFTEKDIKNLYMLVSLSSTDCSFNITLIASFNISELRHVFENCCVVFLNGHRKSAKTREEREDDLNKLLQFFRECKENNEYFYWDVNVDPKIGVIKNIF